MSNYLHLYVNQLINKHAYNHLKSGASNLMLASKNHTNSHLKSPLPCGSCQGWDVYSTESLRTQWMCRMKRQEPVIVKVIPKSSGVLYFQHHCIIS